jgi:hypothetical protein
MKHDISDVNGDDDEPPLWILSTSGAVNCFTLRALEGEYHIGNFHLIS